MSSSNTEKVSLCTQLFSDEFFEDKDAVIPLGNREIQRLARYQEFIWPPDRRVLPVRFQGGTPKLHEKVKKYASLWSRYAEISFDFMFVDDPEIIVSFEPNGGHNSFVGIMSHLSAEINRPSMNLALTDSEDESTYARVITHEFGHAIGFVHEHQSPPANIPWDKPKVYAYYAGPPHYWPPAKVDKSVLNPYGTDIVEFTPFDAQSIMIYAIPPELTTNGFSVKSNAELSAGDKDFAARTYRALNDSGFYRLENINPDAVGDGEANSKIIYFPQVQPTPPTVMVGLKMLNMSNGALDRTLRVRAYANDMSTESFNAHLNSWGDTRLYNGEVAWLKLPRRLQSQRSVFERTRGSSPGGITQRLGFHPGSYTVPPKIFVCLSGFEISDDWNLTVLPTNIDKTGFDLNFWNIGTAKLWGARADYVSFAADTPGVLTGTFYGDANNNFTGHVDFGATFSKTPQALVAINQFNFSNNQSLDFRVGTNITQTGMDWRIQFSGSVYAVGCSYLAVEM